MTLNLTEITGHRVLITGVNGFIGCHAATVAKRAGAEAAGVDLEHTTIRGERIRKSLGGGDVRVYEVKKLTASKLGKILDDFKADLILHLGGTTNRSNEPEAWEVCTERNALLTASVITAVADRPEASRPVLVMAGSQMEYGLAPMPWKENQAAMPVNPYGASKLAAAELLRAAIRCRVLKGCVARLAIVFGPGQPATMIIPELICKGLKKLDVSMTEGKQQRRFVFVADAAKFLLTIGVLLKSGKDLPPLINAPASEPLPIIKIARDVMTALGNPVKLRVGALPERENEIAQAWPDSSLADRLNLISLTPLENSLAMTAAWYRKNEWFFDSMSCEP
jgi:nucleoside-diphosphate-sugar epimerase